MAMIENSTINPIHNVSKTKVRGVMALLKTSSILETERSSRQIPLQFLPEIASFRDLRIKLDIFIESALQQHLINIPPSLKGTLIWIIDVQTCHKRLEILDRMIERMEEFFRGYLSGTSQKTFLIDSLEIPTRETMIANQIASSYGLRPEEVSRLLPPRSSAMINDDSSLSVSIASSSKGSRGETNTVSTWFEQGCIAWKREYEKVYHQNAQLSCIDDGSRDAMISSDEMELNRDLEELSLTYPPIAITPHVNGYKFEITETVERFKLLSIWIVCCTTSNYQI
jgi:hypothetical protein